MLGSWESMLEVGGGGVHLILSENESASSDWVLRSMLSAEGLQFVAVSGRLCMRCCVPETVMQGVV